MSQSQYNIISYSTSRSRNSRYIELHITFCDMLLEDNTCRVLRVTMRHPCLIWDVLVCEPLRWVILGRVYGFGVDRWPRAKNATCLDFNLHVRLETCSNTEARPTTNAWRINVMKHDNTNTKNHIFREQWYSNNANHLSRTVPPLRQHPNAFSYELGYGLHAGTISSTNYV